ncbi:MAG: hypothetical protein RMJ56_10815 [Gemmataceae bacterium]|nr:hypothetical protein [Gemmata sp.]MDW8198081.1 hypothetical protein [Gemmataceae bacterium]
MARVLRKVIAAPSEVHRLRQYPSASPRLALLSGMTPTCSAWLLRWLLRLIGGVELCAIPFVFFPFAGMNTVHEQWLGLGELPNAPIVVYMARSLSALYAVHGALVVRLSWDVVRFRPLIVFLGWLHVILGLVVLTIDVSVGWALWWIVAEGPGIALGGGLIVFLAHQLADDPPA